MAADEVGSVGEEALRLLRALGSSHGDVTQPSESAEHACPNGWCPVCGVVSFVRENPEAVQQVTDTAASLMRALRDLYDSAVNQPPDRQP